MGCQKWRDGLCVGGDCRGCKYSDDAPTTEPGNGWLGLALIMIGLATGVIMGFVLT